MGELIFVKTTNNSETAKHTGRIVLNEDMSLKAFFVISK